MSDEGDLSYLLEKNFSAKRFPRDKKIVLTIKGGGAEEVGQQKQPRPVIRFLEDPRGFILNNTSYEALARAHGTKNVASYVGARVEITWSDSKSSPNGEVGTLLLKVVQPAPKKA